MTASPSTRTTARQREGLLDRPVVVCLGSGGVGKTTLAACYGIAAASNGERAVVLTIDPARRLATTLGLDSEALGNEPVLVDGPWEGELHAAMLDPQQTIENILREHGDQRQMDRLMGNPLFSTIISSLSGSSEYLAAERLHQLHNDPRFDRVIVDTPPSRHAIDFLDSPGRLTRFVDNRLYRAMLAPRRGLLRTVNNAAQMIFRLTARLVGAELVDNVIGLFADMEGLDEGFRTRAVETAALLEGPDCGYALVTTPRYEPIREAGWILGNLERRGRDVDVLVVNRLTPFGRQDHGPVGKKRKRERQALAENWDQLARLAELEDELIDKLKGGLRSPVETILVDEQLEPMSTVEHLAALASHLDPAEG